MPSSFFLSLQPMIPPQRFDIPPPLTGGCSEGLDAFRFFFNGAPFSYRNRTPHLYDFFLLRFVIWLLRAYKYRQLRPWLARNGPETFRHIYNIKKIGWSVDRYKKAVNTGVFASFGISNSRFETSRCHIATCSKRKSAWSRIFIQ